MFFEIAFNVRLQNFNAWLIRYKELTGKSWPQILRKQGRLLAVELAKATPPYGDGDNARISGELSVSRDLRKAYITPGDVFQSLKKTDKDKAGLFYQAFQAGKFRKAEKLLAEAKGNQYRGMRFAQFTPQDHLDRRNKSGRVTGGAPSSIVRNPKRLGAYRKKVQSRVGWAKGAWAMCARAFGGTRGLRQWITRHKRSHGAVIDKTNSEKDPSFSLRNLVEYAERIMPERERVKALRAAQENIISEIKHAQAAIARKSMNK